MNDIHFYKTLKRMLVCLCMLYAVGTSHIVNAKQVKPIAPSLLKPNDVVAIVAPAWWDPNEKAIIEATVQTFRNWGLEVVIGNTIGAQNGQFAGTDEVRLADLQAMIDDPKIKAIFALRGGHGCARIVDDLDFTNFLQHPKWVIGYSDITTLHLQVHHVGAVSIHGIVAKHFLDPAYETSIESLRVALFEGKANIVAEPAINNRLGKAQALVVGGNLIIICSNIGTQLELDTKGKILVLEEVGENFYTIDRLMVQLKRSGKLQHLAGLVIGGITDLKDNPAMPFSTTIEELILHHVAEYNYPVAFHMPIGHTAPNLAFFHGAEGKLVVAKEHATLSFDVK